MALSHPTRLSRVWRFATDSSAALSLRLDASTHSASASASLSFAPASPGRHRGPLFGPAQSAARCALLRDSGVAGPDPRALLQGSASVEPATIPTQSLGSSPPLARRSASKRLHRALGSTSFDDRCALVTPDSQALNAIASDHDQCGALPSSSGFAESMPMPLDPPMSGSANVSSRRRSIPPSFPAQRGSCFESLPILYP